MDAYQSQLIERVGEGILQVAEMEEKRIDEQLKALENMGNLLVLPHYLSLCSYFKTYCFFHR